MIQSTAQMSHDQTPDSVCFLSLVRSPEASQCLSLLIKSLHAFGGPFAQSALWVFWEGNYRPTSLMEETARSGNIAWIKLSGAEGTPGYSFAHKIAACAQAESMAAAQVRSLVWLDPNCLVIQPPTLLELAPNAYAAFRPVHIRNVGSLAGEPLDDYWGTIYQAIGLGSAPYTIQSFVDAQILRPYFNTHLFSIDPSKGILRLWLESFKGLVTDQQFQSSACRSELRQIFLHQAILSALVARLLPRENLRILPPEYSYPLHLQHKIPPARRLAALNDLVCAVYEEDLPHPQTLTEIKVREPLHSWLINELAIIG